MSGNKVTLEEVKTAINVLYKGADVSKKDEASRWLEHFQHSVSIFSACCKKKEDISNHSITL